MTPDDMKDLQPVEVIRDDSLSAEQRESLEKLLAHLKVVSSENMAVLGCGSGDVVELLLKHLDENGRIQALDVSEGLIAQAIKRELPQRVRFQQADLRATNLATESCDRVILFDSFFYHPEREHLLIESYRLLKPGGALVILHSLGSRQLNEEFAQEGGEGPLVPSYAHTESMVESARFSIESLLDGPMGYLLFAVKDHALDRRDVVKEKRKKPRAVGFNGSPHRNGNTATIVHHVLQGAADGGMDFQEFNLNDYQIAPCQICDPCYENGECTNNDGIVPLMEALRDAQLVVVGAPIYMYGVSAQTKLFIDHLYPYVLSNSHRKVMAPKKVILVMTYGDQNPDRYTRLMDMTAEMFTELLGWEVVEVLKEYGSKVQALVPGQEALLELAHEVGLETAQGIKKAAKNKE